jgi:O-antigen ligase/tetratricopeptide (TPR) repeat protein
VLNKASLLQFLVVAMLGLWLADWLVSSSEHSNLNWRSILRSPLYLSVLIFGVLAVISTAASITPSISFWGSYFRKAGLLNLICWILFFLIIAQRMRSRPQLLRAVYTLLLSSAIVSVVGVSQYYFPDAVSTVLPNPVAIRISSTIGNPLFLSSFLAMVIPFNLALIIYKWNRRKEGNRAGMLASLTLLLVFQVWCLWLAQYSITILLYIVSLVVFAIVWGIVRRKRLLLGLGAAALLALAIVAGVLVTPLLLGGAGAGSGEAQGTEPIQISEEAGLYTLGERIQYWRGAADIVIKSPEVPFSQDKLHFLRRAIGYGPETFTVTFQLFFPDKYKSDLTYGNLLVDRPHNDYLYLATTVGLLGLLSFLSILGIFFYLCFRCLRRATMDIDKLILVAIAAGMMQYMTDIFFNLSTIAPELVFWLMLSTVYVIGRLINNKEPERSKLKEASGNGSRAAMPITRTRFYASLGCVVFLVIAGLAIAVRPILADTYMAKGLELQDADNAKAIYAFDQATKIEPEEATYWHSLGAYSYYVAQHIKEPAFKQKVVATAAEYEYRAAELRRYVAYDYYSLADVCTYWAWSGASDKWSLALSFYDKAAHLFPDNAVILDKWSQALIVKGDSGDAKAKLGDALSADADWAQTSFLAGLLLAKEGKNEEAALKCIQPVTDKPSNLSYFVDLNSNLRIYDLVSPLEDSLKAYAEGNPDVWTVHALLGIASLFDDDLNMALDQLDLAMQSAPNDDIKDLFQVILKIDEMSPKLKEALPEVAVGWRDKLEQSPARDTLLPKLEKLVNSRQ